MNGWEVIAEGKDGPGPRSRHGLVYDESNNVTVLFGGILWGMRERMCSDTWELRDHQWTRIQPKISPPARHRGAMVYLKHTGESLLFGGQGADCYSLGDTWLYSRGVWRQWWSWFNKAPVPRCGHCMAYDESLSKAVLFGGVTDSDTNLGSTWLFDGRKWERYQGPSPPPRRYAAMAYDPDLKGCLLQGGTSDESGDHTFEDAWLFTDGCWHRLDDSFCNLPRDDHGLAYHWGAKKMVMLGGLGGGQEILTREEGGWTPRSIEPSHPRHQCAPLTWDAELEGLIMYGGETHHGGSQFDKTLILRLT